MAGRNDFQMPVSGQASRNSSEQSYLVTILSNTKEYSSPSSPSSPTLPRSMESIYEIRWRQAIKELQVLV